MVKSNILVTTLGKVWQLVPELIGFTNPNALPLYRFHSQIKSIKDLQSQYHIEPINALWLITTDRAENDVDVVEKLRQWHTALAPGFELKFFILKNITDLITSRQIRQMSDLIYRVVQHAEAKKGKGRLLLSLAGGRKTMSADMQQAGNLFGCQAMLHVLANELISRDKSLSEFSYLEPLPDKFSDAYLPLIISGNLPRNMALDLPPSIKIFNFPLTTEDEINYIEPDTALVSEINERLANARNLMYNYSLSLSGNHKQTNYRALYALEPEQVQSLQKMEIGVNLERADWEKSLLQKLPKAELHCHFGGILNAPEMIEVAKANQQQIIDGQNSHPEFAQWLSKIENYIKKDNLAGLLKEIPDVKELRHKFPLLPKPLAVAAFLNLFEAKADLLDQFIFDAYLDGANYKNIGIEDYEKLGDLQGSALMQSEASIRTACRILVRKCAQENVRYLELRQSPIKYTQGGLTAERVVDIIRDELQKAEHTVFKAIFIASRHGKMSEIHQHIELTRELFEKNDSYREWIVGFDLAGAEKARSPAELRESFLPLMKESMNLTIHAGENEDVRNIWEAVYHLNADRIGHGLTLNNDSNLKSRFLNRKITIEMCPSSNDQIIGYTETKGAYPLKDYLSRGLRVTVNTDNPGISRTSFSNEYYKAALLSANGLTLWEILQIIRNSFRGAFLPFEKRQKLLLQSEKEIINLLGGDVFV